jgi:uncharacterized protein YndB with AHSA1/START domain
MQQVEVERSFAAPPQHVWDVYTDHAGWSHWAGFRRSWLEVEGREHRNGTGAVRVFSSGGVKATEEVLDFEPPKRMTYRLVRGGLPLKDHLGEVIFEPDGEGTRVIWRCRFESRIPGLGPPMRLLITRIFRNALEGLARYAFSDTTP